LLHQVSDLFELNVKLRCQKLNNYKPYLYISKVQPTRCNVFYIYLFL